MKTIVVFTSKEDLAKRIALKLENLGYRIGGIFTKKDDCIEGIKRIRPEMMVIAILSEGIDGIVKIAKEIRNTLALPIIAMIMKMDENSKRLIREIEPDGFVRFSAKDSEIALTLELAAQRHKKEDLSEENKNTFNMEMLEKLGLLANKVGHDFNNFLMTIMGYATMMKMKASQGVIQEEYLNKILGMVDKAKAYTEDLLSFGRRKTGDLLRINLNQTINRTIPFIKDLINREDIRISLFLSDESPYVMANITQIHRMLSNIIKNSCDAMPEGGEITIKTSVASKKDGLSYAEISISDTGMGMDEATRQRVFEPFFTTKPSGKGIGIGLSIVYGIVKQHSGFIEVESELGKGSTFYIF